MLIGYARCSTVYQDLTTQRQQLEQLGVARERIYCDKGFSGRTADRPGLQQAIAATRTGDTFVVTKLDRLARSLKELLIIMDSLHADGVGLQIGTSVYDPDDPASKLLLHTMGTIAEFESDIIRQRTRESLVKARAEGKLRGRKPKITPQQRKHIIELGNTGDYTHREIAELMGCHRSTIGKILREERQRIDEQYGIPDGVKRLGIPEGVKRLGIPAKDPFTRTDRQRQI